MTSICSKTPKYERNHECVQSVQESNADFGQQMVYQSSLCYKDLTLRHFVVSSTSVRHAGVKNQKSVYIMLCCCVQYVEIYTEQRAFADSINFRFHLKKTAAESCLLFLETYGEHAPSQNTCCLIMQWVAGTR